MRTPAVSLLLFLNIAVFLAWIALGTGSQLMVDNFLVSFSGLLEGRVWTLLTSEFSHVSFMHIFLNMFALQSFGPLLELTLGSRRFLGFYLVAACVASLSHSVLSAFLLGEPDLPALGASGAVSGVILVFSLIFPKQKILILGIIPVPALVGAALLVGLDLWGLYAQAHGGQLPIGHGAHLGGSFTGLAYYWFWLRPRLRERY